MQVHVMAPTLHQAAPWALPDPPPPATLHAVPAGGRTLLFPLPSLERCGPRPLRLSWPLSPAGGDSGCLGWAGVSHVKAT